MDRLPCQSGLLDSGLLSRWAQSVRWRVLLKRLRGIVGRKAVVEVGLMVGIESLDAARFVVVVVVRTHWV